VWFADGMLMSSTVRRRHGRESTVDIAATLAEIERLTIDERLALVEAIWDSIAAESEQMSLTDAQRTELERRLADDDANPDDVVPWEVVHAQALATLPMNESAYQWPQR